MIIRELTQEEADIIIYPLVNSSFENTFSYPVMNLRTQTEIDAFPRLKESFRKREFLFLAAYEEEDFLGFSISFQARSYELYTQTSVVLENHRRKGIYTALTRHIQNWARVKGYQMITSNHVAANNSVIVAKLKLGFKITGFELVDDFGSLVKLTYFVNETRDRLFDVRSGLRRPDEGERKILNLE